MPSYQQIRTGRLYEEIVRQIEDLILEGELEEGDQFPPERELAEQFGVSRTAVREAMKVLRQKGLAESHPGRGTFVTYGTITAMRDSLGLLMRFDKGEGQENLVEVRQILEPEIAQRAAIRRDEEHLAMMAHAIVQMDRSTLEDSDPFIEADLEFHLALAKATHNPLIVALLDSIVDLLRDQRREIFLRSGGARRGNSFHKRIFEAVKTRQPAAAREAMRAHLEQVREDTSAAEQEPHRPIPEGAT